MRVIFLDIDGGLNSKEFFQNRQPTQELNEIVKGVKVIIYIQKGLLHRTTILVAIQRIILIL